ncbi:MAG: TonB-dependent receptor [Nitrospinaceae bacterium]|nr:MAG: TonB-dependent receptor [Nitrospinaceae bacterium]
MLPVEDGFAQGGNLAGKLEPPYEELPPIDITAVRSRKKSVNIPAAVDKVTGPDVQRGRPSLTLDEPLVSLPGLFFQNQSNFAQDLRISIRGFGARSPFGVRGVKVLVDGIPYTMPDGQTQLDSIDPGIIDSIEVIRGPSSSLFGNASGGVISIVTEEGPDTPLEFNPRFTAGEFGFKKLQMKVGGQTDSMNYNFYTSHLQSDGFRQNSATENTLLSGKFRVYPDEASDWTFSVSQFNSPLAEDPGALTKAQADANPERANANNLLFSAGERVTEQNLGSVYKRNLTDRLEGVFTLHLNHRNFSNKLPFTSGGTVEFERLAPGIGLKTIWDTQPLGLTNRLVSGVDFFYQRDDRKRFDNNLGQKGSQTLDQIENVFTVGPYLRNELKPFPWLDLAAGVRYDWVRFELQDVFLMDGDQSDSRNLSEFSGMLGAVIHVNETLHLYGNVATAFEVPTTTELIVNPSGGPGFNPGLEAQKSVSYEVGVKGELQKVLRYDLAFFLIESTDELVPFELPGSPGRNFFRNAGESERKGLEAKLHFQPAKRVSGSLSYTFSDFKFTEFTSNGTDVAGNRIPGIPEHRIAGTLSATSGGGYFGRFEFQTVGEFFVDNENTTRNASYTSTSLVLGKEGEAGPFLWSIFLGLNNLLDQNYNANTRINAGGGRFFEPASPFNVYGGISISYSPLLLNEGLRS